MPQRTPISLWDMSSEEPDPACGFAGTGAVDVAIVGAGYTGLSTALHCAEQGLNAHVVEAHGVGHGGSGRNVGLVNAGVWLPPGKVRKIMGDAAGQRFVARFGDAPEQVFSLIERHQIRCEARRNGTIHAAHAASGLRDLQARWRDWQALGAPVDLLDAAETARRTGTTAFRGGLVDRRAGTVNPMGYCRGLARAAQAAGATISTGITVTGLSRAQDRWQLATDHGPLTARAVVLGTNAYTDRLWPGLRRDFTTIRFFQLSTVPLGARAGTILPGGEGLWDTGQIMTSLRRDASGRLIIGSMGRLIGVAAGGLSRRWAAKRLARLFPDLGPVTFESAWDGAIAMTADHLPRIHALDENLYTPIGYNGRGITTGTVFGAAMAALLSGGDPDKLPLPLTRPARMRGGRLLTRFYDLAFSVNQLVKGL